MKFPALPKLAWFVRERERIRLKKEAGKPRPWTIDPVLHAYRFCNVRREDDYETRWIAANWRRPGPDVWFAMLVARLINWHPTLAVLPYPVPWGPEAFKNTLRSIEGQVFTGAYMINQSVPGGKGLFKGDYLADVVLPPIWAARKAFPRHGTLDNAHQFLMQFPGLGSFMAAQVIADTKYTPVLAQAGDWHTWAASGPGSRRGMNVALGREPDAPWREEDWRAAMAELRPVLNRLTKLDLHAQDVQSLLCELFKYHRGSSRSRYQPRGEQ